MSSAGNSNLFVVNPETAHHRWLSWLVLTLLVLATCLPFLNQAYHIDDRIYLDVARNIQVQPLHPYDFNALYEGFIAPDAASHSHLPFTSYYLALVQLATGSQSEWVAHLAFLIFPLLAALAFYELASGIVRFPLAAAALLVSSTAFLTLSHTIMPDVALLSFWILALASFHHFLRDPASTWAWRVCLGAILAAAFMSLLTAALVLLLGADWLLYRRSAWRKDKARFRIALVLAAPFLLWFLWYLRAYLHYDRFVLVNTFLHMEQRAPFSLLAVGSKLLSFLLHLGGTFLFPVAGWLAFTGRTSRRIYVAVFFVAFIPAYLWYPEWPWLQACLFALFLTTALLTIVKISQGSVRLWRDSRAGKSTSEGVFWLASGTALSEDSKALMGVLFLWFWGILAACCLAFYSGSVRYAVLALPPFLLLWQYALETGHSTRAARLALLSLALTLPYSLSIASADYRFAEVYREEPARILGGLGDRNQQIWYTGEWGFRYYMEKLGARPLTKTGVGPVAGDIIVKPNIALPWITLYDSEEFVGLLEQRHVDPGSAFRILDFQTSAGFYSSAWGILPVSLNQGLKWEWFNVYQVKKKYDGPVPEIERPW